MNFDAVCWLWVWNLPLMECLLVCSPSIALSLPALLCSWVHAPGFKAQAQWHVIIMHGRIFIPLIVQLMCPPSPNADGHQFGHLLLSSSPSVHTTLV